MTYPDSFRRRLSATIHGHHSWLRLVVETAYHNLDPSEHRTFDDDPIFLDDFESSTSLLENALHRVPRSCAASCAKLCNNSDLWFPNRRGDLSTCSVSKGSVSRCTSSNYVPLNIANGFRRKILPAACTGSTCNLTSVVGIQPAAKRRTVQTAATCRRSRVVNNQVGNCLGRT